MIFPFPGLSTAFHIIIIVVSPLVHLFRWIARIFKRTAMRKGASIMIVIFISALVMTISYESLSLAIHSKTSNIEIATIVEEQGPAFVVDHIGPKLQSLSLYDKSPGVALTVYQVFIPVMLLALAIATLIFMVI